MIILKELLEHVDEELKELLSLKNPEQYVSTTPEMLTLSHHVNSFQMIRSCHLKKNLDYIPINVNKHPELVGRMIWTGLCKNQNTSKTTLFFESGILKIMMGSKNKTGDEFRELLAEDILPTLLERNSGSSILSSFKSTQ